MRILLLETREHLKPIFLTVPRTGDNIQLPGMPPRVGFQWVSAFFRWFHSSMSTVHVHCAYLWTFHIYDVALPPYLLSQQLQPASEVGIAF